MQTLLYLKQGSVGLIATKTLSCCSYLIDSWTSKTHNNNNNRPSDTKESLTDSPVQQVHTSNLTPVDKCFVVFCTSNPKTCPPVCATEKLNYRKQFNNCVTHLYSLPSHLIPSTWHSVSLSLPTLNTFGWESWMFVEGKDTKFTRTWQHILPQTLQSRFESCHRGITFPSFPIRLCQNRPA